MPSLRRVMESTCEYDPFTTLTGGRTSPQCDNKRKPTEPTSPMSSHHGTRPTRYTHPLCLTLPNSPNCCIGQEWPEDDFVSVHTGTVLLTPPQLDFIQFLAGLARQTLSKCMSGSWTKEKAGQKTKGKL